MKVKFQPYFSISAEKASNFDTQNKKNLGFKSNTPDFVVEYRMGQITGTSSTENQREIEKRLGKLNPTQSDIENYTKLYEISDNTGVNRSRNLLIARLELNFCDLEISKIIGERERNKRAKKFPYISIDEADKLIELESLKVKYQNQIAHIENVINRIQQPKTAASTETETSNQVTSLEVLRQSLYNVENGIEQARNSGNTTKELSLYRSKSILMQKILTLEPTFNPDPAVSPESIPTPVIPNSPEQKENIKVAKVYEFWTAVKLGRNSSGKAVSNGFGGHDHTGGYMMNSFEGDIPSGIKSAISNRFFKISEGTSQKDPSVVSRIVESQDGKTWSIVALVSRFDDEVGRSGSGYRYFAVEGNSFDPILAELKSKKANGDNGEFDLEKVMQGAIAIPKATQKEYQPEKTTLSPELKQIITEAKVNNTIPLVLPFGIACSFEQSVILARLLTKNQSSSVAYKVSAVERPEAFAVIIPFNSDAETTLKKQIDSLKKLEIEQNSIDSQKIYSAFKGLMNGNLPDNGYTYTLQDTFNKISNPKEKRREEYDIAINKHFIAYDLEGAILHNRNTKQMIKLQALAHLFGADIGKTKLPIERMILTTKRVLRKPLREINPDVKILLDNLEQKSTGIFQKRVRDFKAELQSKL